MHIFIHTYVQDIHVFIHTYGTTGPNPRGADEQSELHDEVTRHAEATRQTEVTRHIVCIHRMQPMHACISCCRFLQTL